MDRNTIRPQLRWKGNEWERIVTRFPIVCAVERNKMHVVSTNAAY
jgi:hypothetical protein